MADRKIRLSKSQADDFAALCAVGPDLLLRVAQAIEALPLTIKRERVQKAIVEAAGADHAEPIERVVFGLATVHRRNFDDTSSILERLDVPRGWSDSQRQSWHDCKPSIDRLLSAKSIVLSTKAADLSLDVERYCISARIITDIRPVFDEVRAGIVGSAIRQTFRIEYMSPNGVVTSLSIGLDEGDIKKIQKSCQEAINKTQTISKMLNQANITEILVPGEE